jgi:predicted amidohydrolase
MANKIVSYTLQSDGTIPTFILDGGYLLKQDAPNSQMFLVGVADENADLSTAINIFETEEELQTYVKTYITEEQYEQDDQFYSVGDLVTSIYNKIKV